jgi:hypothetical protein
MREPADKSLLTDVSRFRSCRCTIIASTTTHGFVERPSCGATGLDMGHKRMAAGSVLLVAVLRDARNPSRRALLKELRTRSGIAADRRF